MDLKELSRSLDDVKRKLMPPPPPSTGTPVHRIGANLSHTDTQNFTCTSSGRIRKTRAELEAERDKENERQILKERNLNKASRPPSPGRLKQLSTDKSRFFLDLERKKEAEELTVLELGRKRVTSEIEAAEAAQRLYEEAQRRERRLAKLRLEERERERVENIPPPPPASRPPPGTPNVFKTPREPLHERSDAIIKQRQEHLAKLRISLDSQQQRLHRQLPHKVDPEEVTERLLHEAKELERRKQNEKALFLALEKPRGAPTINDRSRKLVESKYGERRLSFTERQEAERREREQRLAEKQTNEAIKAQIGRGKVLSPKTAKATVHRLAEEDTARLKEKRIQVENEYMSKFTFTPQIDERSRLLTPRGSGGVESLYRNDEAVRKRSELAARIERERMEHCPFQPQILPNQYWHQSELLEENRRKREEERKERLRRVKWEQEALEASECTFQPFINPSPASKTFNTSAGSTNSAEIKGLDRYLERKRQAEEMRQVQREREDKVFMKNLAPTVRRYTVAQPFNLSG